MQDKFKTSKETVDGGVQPVTNMSGEFPTILNFLKIHNSSYEMTD